jgi:hypothetical protein
LGVQVPSAAPEKPIERWAFFYSFIKRKFVAGKIKYYSPRRGFHSPCLIIKQAIRGLLIIIFGLLFILSVLAFYFGLSSEAGSNLLKFIAMIIFTSLLNFYKIAMLSAEKESMEVKNGKVVLNYFVGGIKFSNTIKLKISGISVTKEVLIFRLP